MPFRLVRDDAQPSGFAEYAGALPRTKQESYVPWAITQDGRVVYANSVQYRNKPSRAGLTPYNSFVSKQRRRLCQSALGSLALEHPAFWKDAVKEVSSGVKRFLVRKYWASREPTLDTFSKQVGKYLYGTSYMSFGRISDVVPTGAGAPQQMWDQCLEVLDNSSPLPTTMGLHDQVAIKMLARGDAEFDTYRSWTTRFRADNVGEMFHADSRGRAPASGRPVASTQAGIATPDDGSNLPGVQSRKRGVDSFVRSSFPTALAKAPDTARPALSGVDYYQDLDARNELFGAGPSGTTGTLLASAMTFGKLDHEGARQYLLAIIGYLVGGGMHSLHESMTVVKLLPQDLHMEYNPGSLLRYETMPPETLGGPPVVMAKANDFPALPRTFLASPQFAVWRHEYYDIVVLGGLHWMFNER